MPQAERPYRALGYPITPLLYILVAVLFVGYIVLGDPRSSLLGLGLVLLGLPVYFVIRRRAA